MTRHLGKTFRPRNAEEAEVARKALEAAAYVVARREDKPTRKNPPPPFITSTLQQAASTGLGFSVKKTMTLAQRLYEAGLITYMRTDSTNLSAEALAACRAHIEGAYGARYLPDQPHVYRSGESAQEAHEAIRPSDVQVAPASIEGFDRDAVRLYDLVWRRFVACQMKAAEYHATVVSVAAGDYELRANGRVMIFDGWTRVLPLGGKDTDDVVLPSLEADQKLKLLSLDLSQHFTKPPPRFSEAGLVKELEKRGIGRPSTYASIISTIQDRGYVRLENRRFYAEKMGDVVTERLLGYFDEILDYGFTASLEQELDGIAQGKLDWKEALDRFYRRFKKDLSRAGAEMAESQPTKTDIPCSVCGRPMMIRTARTGVFLSCSGYDLPPKERCKNTVNLIRGDEVEHVDDEGENGESEARALLARHRCPKCGTAMDSYLIDESSKLHICGNNPDCDGFEVEKGRFRIKGYDGPVSSATSAAGTCSSRPDASASSSRARTTRPAAIPASCCATASRRRRARTPCPCRSSSARNPRATSCCATARPGSFSPRASSPGRGRPAARSWRTWRVTAESLPRSTATSPTRRSRTRTGTRWRCTSAASSASTT